MRVFVAGATGVIGRPVVAELVRQGHSVTGLTRPGSGAKQLSILGAAAAEVSAFDRAALEQALRQSEAEVVIDELTSLPKDPYQFAAAFPGDRKLRIEGGGNLHRAAQAAGVRRYLQMSSGFFLKAAHGLANETSPLATDASPAIAVSAQMYAEIESRLADSGKMEAVVLRYGFFYGPGTWYCPEGAAADQVRRQQQPIVGRGEAIWSWIHVDDAARATVQAISAPPGIYNIVDDDPLPVGRWLPEFARFLGAPPPPHVTEQEARQIGGEDAVYYGTRLCGASNAKAKQTFGFQARRLEWLK